MVHRDWGIKMLRTCVALMALTALAACGGGTRYSSSNGAYRPAPVLFAEGPIQKACVAQDRKNATYARCGCIQAIANQTMSWSDQRWGAKFFKDPHQAQELRQSSRPKDERFWLTWKAFGQDAAAACDNT